MKDWIGSPQSVFMSLGASNHTKETRQEVDYYATDPYTLTILLDKIKKDGIILPKRICEPACGAGHLSKELERQGFIVDSYDLYDHGYGTIGQDFLKSKIKAECFLTNPPYKFALEFVKHALENLLPGGYSVMLLKIQFLEGKKRNRFFKRYPPKYVYINSSRQVCAKNGDFVRYSKGKAICYGWFIWQKEFSGEPIIRWID